MRKSFYCIVNAFQDYRLDCEDVAYDADHAQSISWALDS